MFSDSIERNDDWKDLPHKKQNELKATFLNGVAEECKEPLVWKIPPFETLAFYKQLTWNELSKVNIPEVWKTIRFVNP